MRRAGWSPSDGMNLDDIRQILDLVREHDLAELEIERDGLKVRVRKAGDRVDVIPPIALPVAPAPVPAGARSISSTASCPTSEIVRSPVRRSNEKRHGFRSP